MSYDLTQKQAECLMQLPDPQPYPFDDKAYWIATGKVGATIRINNRKVDFSHPATVSKYGVPYKLPQQPCPCCGEKSDNSRFLNKATLWALAQKKYLRILEETKSGMSLVVGKKP